MKTSFTDLAFIFVTVYANIHAPIVVFGHVDVQSFSLLNLKSSVYLIEDAIQN